MIGSSTHPSPNDLDQEPARVFVWGLGYVGLTTAHALLNQGVRVVGIDNNAMRIRQLRESTLTLHRSLPGLQLDFRNYIASGQMSLTTRLASPVSEAPIHFVCVPTEADGVPSDAALEDVMAKIDLPASGGCIIVESTIAPSWLDRPYFASGRVCLAPRRDWFHSAQHTVQSLTRVMAASDEDTAGLARSVLGLVSHNIVRSDNLAAVAFSKAYENSLWLLMASYTNYLSQAFAHVDMREVIRLSQTNWRTQFELYPGLRVGGYCLPLSIEYIAEAHPHGRFSFAGEVKALNNASVEQLLCRLRGREPKRVLVLGLAYRPEVRVHTESAGLMIAKGLRRYGITCHVHDPLYSRAEICAITGVSAGNFPDDLLTSDVVVMCVAHKEYREFDLRSYLAEHVVDELTVYDGTGAWSDSLAGVGDEAGLVYRNLGTPSWVAGEYRQSRGDTK